MKHFPKKKKQLENVKYQASKIITEDLYHKLTSSYPIKRRTKMLTRT